MTESAWPDPTDWINGLTHDLTHRIAAYESETDADLKRNKAAGYIGCIAGHLGLLPAFRNNDLLMPIKDLLIFMHALEHGGSGHPWTKPVNYGGTNAETLAETEVRVWVVMGVWSLLEGGYSKNKAYKYLARAMTESGRTSKGQPYSHRNIQRWWLAYENGTDPRLEKVQEHIENYWAKMPCPHGRRMYECGSRPDSRRCAAWRGVAEEFAANALKVANFRDWFVSR